MQRLSFLLAGLILSTFAVRIVVDDANSTWTYSGSWIAITPSTPCSTCFFELDASKMYNSTWHYTTDPSTAQLGFFGVSIEIYAICPQLLHLNGAGIGTLNFSFTLDNVGDGIFSGPQTGCNHITYNYLAYARTNLTLGAHVIQITTTPTNGLGGILLDYAIYDDGTVPSSLSLPPSTSPIPHPTSHSSAAIAGLGTVTGLLLLANIAQYVWYYHLSRRFRPQADTTHKGSASPVEPVPPVQQESLLEAQSSMTGPNDSLSSIPLAATSHLPASGKQAPNTETMNRPDIPKL